MPRQPLADKREVGIHAPDVDHAKGSLIPVGAGNLKGDILPEDEVRKAGLGVAGELLPTFRGVDTLEPHFDLPISFDQKRQAVSVTHPDNPSRDRLAHGRVNKGHDPDEKGQPDTDGVDWSAKHEENIRCSPLRFQRFRATCRVPGLRPESGMLVKIVSGGQTGADIAALDVALRHDFPHGGWCPKGRKSLDGPIPSRYLLTETPSSSYLQRTEWNVRDSDGTAVFTLEPEATGGSLKTIQFARKHIRPVLHLSGLGIGYSDPALLLQKFVDEHKIETLNVAGSRESKEPGIHAWVMEVLENAFFWSENHPGMLGGPGEG